MTTRSQRIERLLVQINDGRAAQALPELDRLLRRQPADPAALTLRAEALRLAGRVPEAVDAYRRAGERGGGTRNWLLGGLLLAAERKTDEALLCLRRAHAESPDDAAVLDTLITTLFNSNRARDGLEFARRQLAHGQNPQYLANAALLLQSCDCYEEASDAFKKILRLAPGEPALIGSALAVARFTCDWEWVESLQQRIGALYEQGSYAAPCEYPLTNLTWCVDEAVNLAVTRAYAERTVPRPQGSGPEPGCSAMRRANGERIRVGYLSCDFRNHATMHLMIGLLEAHDRARFEVFAYDYTAHDISEYRRRFLEAVEHHIEIHSLSDREAAERIAQDRLDILFDLKVYTGGCRPSILAYRPAPLQAAYLGFPGSAASAAIDYIVSDRFVTPDRSACYYSEQFCRLPHSYQCNDGKRPMAPAAGARALHGLPDDQVVFGAFNQSYKIDRASFVTWLQVLQQVPGSVLWVLGHNNAAIAQLSRHAELAGLSPGRLIFAPFANPSEHLARLQLADAILDTLACNGHTTTSDALWAGVPVVTARGEHFASRVSESLLNAMDLPELVGNDHADMVRIAARIGQDAEYRAALRSRVRANRVTAPLFDTARFTRNFETAIEMMLEQPRSAAARAPIDVPDCGPLPQRSELRPPDSSTLPLQAAYVGCPLCGATSVTLGFANCTSSSRWHAPLPAAIEWLRCPSCAHVHRRGYWTEAGVAELLRAPHEAALTTGAADWRTRREPWTAPVERVVALLGGYRALAARAGAPIWVDVGSGDGGLVLAAADYGFAAVGLDIRADSVGSLQALGLTALQQDFMQLKFELAPEVLSLMDVLEQMPDPAAALRKAAQILRPGAVLVISSVDLISSGWRSLEVEGSNPYWSEIERCHLFSRQRLVALLAANDFEVVDFSTPVRRRAQMELYALRR